MIEIDRTNVLEIDRTNVLEIDTPITNQLIMRIDINEKQIHKYNIIQELIVVSFLNVFVLRINSSHSN